MPTYHPAVFRTSGGNEMGVASSGRIEIQSGGEIDIEAGGRLEIAGTAFITSGGGVNLASLTSGDVTLPGALTVSSGLAVTAASTFSAAVAFSSGIAVTGASTFSAAVAFSSGIAVTGASTFSAGVNVSSGLLVGAGSSFSTGIRVAGASTFAEAVAFSTGIVVTGASTFSAHITLTSGISGTTGAFTGDFAARGYIATVVNGTSSGGALTLAGLITVKSTAGDPVVYTVAPVVGYICYIRCAASCATTGAAIVTTTGTWDGSNANVLFSTGNTNPQFLGFIGVSTSRWQVLTTAYSTEISFSNT